MRLIAAHHRLAAPQPERRGWREVALSKSRGRESHRQRQTHQPDRNKSVAPSCEQHRRCLVTLQMEHPSLHSNGRSNGGESGKLLLLLLLLLLRLPLPLRPVLAPNLLLALGSPVRQSLLATHRRNRLVASMRPHCRQPAALWGVCFSQ
jgi:hypothetical protein|eukprot:COSAG02_NODE_6611_length_3461_cov_2.567222_2_plen_149_part_00